ncbi:acyltransferase [Anditalea andensis]|uniref:Acyltransferase n=1 Tax=Anditalea andensis TaxID=1048983 RepID=A0A074KVL3_9BACT|nr:hypothetical protein [Anditalea andensis]KEO72295.1 hypothetical protein EL17_16220 [Anditalea andensis]
MVKKIITLLLPWTLRRKALNKWFGYQIDISAKIGMAWVFPKNLIMKAGSKIDHFTVAIHLDKIHMEKATMVGRSNWITGFPSGSDSLHFAHQYSRTSELFLDEESAITKNHHIDCTNSVYIGKYSTIAGYYSQILTHSINIMENRQDSAPIHIGNYCFIGTNTVILGGAVLPDNSILGAKSLLNKACRDSWKLYGGVPAKPISDIPKTAKYFLRKDGFVY